MRLTIFTKTLLFTLSLFISLSVSAKESLNVVVGLTKPPYVIADLNSGFELELIENVLAQQNKSPEFIYVPFGRSERMLKEHDIDMILTVNDFIIKNKAYLSKPYITYQNVAISLNKNNFVINTIKDLKNHSLATFQSAHKVLGNEFAKAAEVSPVYIQIAKQKIQLEMLFKERVDVIIMDLNIFNYYLQKLYPSEDFTNLAIHQIFPKTHYSAAFKNSRLLNDFNQQLEIFLSTEQYRQLRHKYQLIGD
ncbi:substrate-binding periplasmic protein [Thalassotalea sediminis]|uniref:substrate-binding periplasmic protein n=1 Tax=Thalassotalea sediminis TaxID=1759089 RepID=UPI0025731566|nr:transporter substrate-binding domain-containing protein [Thalassotalea sediminis]